MRSATVRRSLIMGSDPFHRSVGADGTPEIGLAALPETANLHPFRRVTRQAEEGGEGDAAPYR